MANTLKRQYNVPLRSSFIKAVKYKKTNKAVKSLKEFISKHMKADIKNVKLGQHVNETLWARGDCKPPHHVLVDCEKNEEGIVKVELSGKAYKESVRPEKKAEEAETLQDKIQNKIGTKDDKKTEEKATKEADKKEQPAPKKVVKKVASDEVKKTVKKKIVVKKEE